ncbi:MAG: 3-deoxy-D-manno-octulosonic acid transferase [Nitrospirae bacterium]|nr:MAG: 3-deoxy-D-manno-octulosonic acid transferase [Nitrospirota bacterium]
MNFLHQTASIKNSMTFSSMIPRLIYSVLYLIALLFLLPFEYRKRPKEFRRRWLREKFGTFNFQLSTLNSSIIWIHAVSVGEVMAAIPLLKRLKERFPSANLIVSTITDTGQRIALEKTPYNTKVIYLPFDLVFILKRALKSIQPSLFIAMETELWPNLFREVKKQGIPVMIMNGRISDDSFKGYKKIKFFMREIIGCVDLFGMQDSVYAQRIKALGAREDKIRVLGNFKFDTKPSENIPEWTKAITHPVIIAGSTHRGEEDLIIAAFTKLKTEFPELNLIIAPRHPERFTEVEELVKSKGFEYAKRSELKAESREQRAEGQIVILDAMGELSSTYAACDIAIMGGSFITHGGQNLLEPAYWAKPVICGPHMENFPFAKEFYEKGAAIEVDESGIVFRLKELLQSPEKRDAVGNKAKELYNEKAGAVDRAIKEIEKFLN